MKSSRRTAVPRTSTSTSTHRVPSSTLGHENKVVPPPSRIPQNKWTEIQNDENANRIVNSIREEIIQKAMNTLYKDYLMNGSCMFVVNCAHIAWLQLFNWMHLMRDAGESEPTVKERWTGDVERAPVPRDNWAFGNVEIQKISSPYQKQEICKEACEQEEISRILPKNVTLPSVQVSSGEFAESIATKIVSASNEEGSMQTVHRESSEEVFVAGENYEETIEREEEVISTEYKTGESSDRTEVLSIFTRTISMPKEELPIPRRLSVQNRPTLRGNDVSQRKNWQSWKLDSVKAPRKLSLDRFPADR